MSLVLVRSRFVDTSTVVHLVVSRDLYMCAGRAESEVGLWEAGSDGQSFTRFWGDSRSCQATGRYLNGYAQPVNPPFLTGIRAMVE